MKYGLQMYSVRDITKDDLPGAVAKVAQMGYKLIEFAGFFGHTAEEVNKMLSDNGVTVSGTHTGLAELLNDYEGTVAFHKAIKNPIYIIPGHDLSTKEKLDQFIEDVNRLQPMLKAEGIEMGFHNHSGEFKPNMDGIIVHTELEKRADIFFEIDTYWAFVAGLDPIATIERLGDRVKCIHLKDGTPEGRGYSLGLGSAPVAAVRAKAIELGLGIVVESEGCEPTGKEEVERCINYLKSLD